MTPAQLYPGFDPPDGPGTLELPGLLAKLQAAAEDLAAVKAVHEADASAAN